MNPHTLHWLLGASQGAANAVIAGTWQGLVLAAAVGLCLSLSSKISAATRFTIWTVAFAALAALPFLPLPVSAATAALGQSRFEPSMRAVFHLDARWSLGIAALWIISSSFRAGALLRDSFRLRRLWSSARPLDSPWGAALNADPALNKRQAEVCTSTEIDQPSVIGFFSPRILVPAWLLERLTGAELQQIVLHEREHLRRRDDWLNLLQKVGLALFPLNPVLMWIEKRLCTERELACDDGVVRATQVPGAYASCLTSLAESSLAKRSRARRATSLSLGAWEPTKTNEGKSALSRRVYAILRHSEGLSPMQARGLTAAVLLGLVLGGGALSQCPRLVSFSTSGASAENRLPSALSQPVYPADLMHNVSFKTSRSGMSGGASSIAGSPKLIDANLVSNSAPAYPNAKLALKSAYPASHRQSGAARQRRLKTIQRSTIHQDQQNREWLMVTSWEDSNSPSVVLTVVHYTRESASGSDLPAFPGWIFFQL